MKKYSISIQRKGTITLIILALIGINAFSQSGITHNEMMLWPESAPGSAGLALTEIVDERSPDTSAFHNRIISGVKQPSITPFLPDNPNGTAVLICPGGGYTVMAFDKEGIEIAEWLNSLGITAFVLKYRLPAEGHNNGKYVPLQDAQRAIRTIRQKAKNWKIDPDKIGVMGFSAGGHLASSLGVSYNKKVYDPIDDLDEISARPDFMMLVYPVISMKADITHKGSREKLLGKSPSEKIINEHSTNLHIDSETTPTFLILANDDKAVIPQNSLLFYEGLLDAGVDVALHIFQQGGHGFGMREAQGPVAQWPVLCRDWLSINKLINPDNPGNN